MSTLRARLEAKLDEIEALAHGAYDAEPGGWHVHHNPTRTGRADEWEVRDQDGDSLAWVGVENDARLIAAVASPDVALRQVAHGRRILTLVGTLRDHAAKRREIASQSGWANDLDAYADELLTGLAEALGVSIEEPA